MSSSTDYQIQIKGVVVNNRELLFDLAFPKANPSRNLMNLKIAYDLQVAGNAATFCSGHLNFSNFTINTKSKISRAPRVLIPLRPTTTGKYDGNQVQVNLIISAPNIRFVPLRASINISGNEDGSIRYSASVQGSTSITITPNIVS